MKSKNTGLLIGGIISGVFGMVFGIIGMVCRIIGTVFVRNPENVTVTINGRVLEGEEAVEEALKIGEIMVKIGGGSLIVASILALICLVLVIIYFVKRNNDHSGTGYNGYSGYQ